MKNSNYFIFIIVVYINYVYSQTFPSNPCPDLFKYLQNNGVIFGRVEFPNDYSGNYRLTVNMSVAALLSNDKNIRLELKTTSEGLRAGQDVIYDIHFPIKSVLPKPTRIEFNDRVYCTGSAEQVHPGRGVTNMWATIYKGVSIPSRPSRPSVTTRRTTQVVRPTNPSVYFPYNPFLPSVTSTARPAVVRTTTRTTRTTTTRPTTRSTTRATTQTTTTTPRNIQPEQQCGGSSVNIQQLIVRGDTVDEGQFPWLAAIMYRQDLDYRYRCTGSLVTNLHVITAAHCVQFFKAPLIPVEDLLIIFGKVSIRNWANEAVIRGVQNFTAHPDYQQQKGDGDIAILTLKRTVQFEDRIQPVCLWQEDNDLNAVVGKSGTVAGWGRDETGKNFVTEAKQINLPIVEQATCLRSDAGFVDITSNRTFCAGTLNNSGPCSGDSGAGFVMRTNGRWTLRGVVSTALKDAGTCDLTKYTVFADVAKFGSWIRNALQ